MKNWNVGVYIRLSQEDGDKEESNSITNQRELINTYLEEEQDLKIYDYYIDDGWSGTNFDRPNFKRLINDIETGIINTIIVKDLSRFGRNYIEVGNYLERIFPIKNIRFIAINDCIDSFKDPESIESIIVPFKNLMNDEYCRDISQKVKYALNTRKRNGEFMAGIVPFGYKRSEEDKHKLVIDEEAAKIVKKIYSYALKGLGTTTIARKLNESNIPTPSIYKKEVQKIKCKFRNDGKKNYWSDSSVSSILRNRIYLGEMVQCKFRKLSYKIDKRVKNDKSDWIIVKDTHESIISYKDFDKVQKILDSRGWRCNNDGTVSIFAGKIKCGDCKSSMTRNKTGKPKKDGTPIIHYYCSTYMRKSKKLCTRHSINIEVLEPLILKTIKKQIELVLDTEKLIKEIYEENSKEKYKTEYQNNINSLNDELKKLDVLKREAYMDWKKEIITQNDYFSFVEVYSKNISEINKRITEYQNKINEIKDESIDNYIALFKQYKNINKIDKEVVDELIDTIYVYENNKIEIVFKYNDIYKQITNIIKEENHER